MEYKLSDLFALQMGKTPARDEPRYWQNGNHPWISIADLSSADKFIESTKETISDLAVEESNIYRIPEGTVVMSFKLSLGKVAITKSPMFSNEAIMAFVPRVGVDISTDYLYYLLKAKRWDTDGNKAVKGITLNKATLANVKVHIHSADEQRLIVHILDKLWSVIKQRQAQLAKLDELVKCRFVEMFGDPVTNSKQWKVVKLSIMGDIGRGTSKHRPRNAEFLLNGPYPLIQTGDISTAGTYITKHTSTYSESGLKQSKMWPKGTLVITIAANIAETGILTYPACFPDSVVGFIANPQKTNPIFIHYWFTFFQHKLEQEAPQVAQKNINLKILNDLEVICPTVDLQTAFADFVRRVDKLRFV